MTKIYSLFRKREFCVFYAIIMMISSSLNVNAQFSQNRTLNSQDCTPLTPLNYEVCCIAFNRASMLSPAELDLCRPLTPAQILRVAERTAEEAVKAEHQD